MRLQMGIKKTAISIRGYYQMLKNNLNVNDSIWGKKQILSKLLATIMTT